jgi:hypothetical protein
MAQESRLQPTRGDVRLLAIVRGTLPREYNCRRRAASQLSPQRDPLSRLQVFGIADVQVTLRTDNSRA